MDYFVKLGIDAKSLEGLTFPTRDSVDPSTDEIIKGGRKFLVTVSQKAIHDEIIRGKKPEEKLLDAESVFDKVIDAFRELGMGKRAMQRSQALALAAIGAVEDILHVVLRRIESAAPRAIWVGTSLEYLSGFISVLGEQELSTCSKQMREQIVSAERLATKVLSNLLPIMPALVEKGAYSANFEIIRQLNSLWAGDKHWKDWTRSEWFQNLLPDLVCHLELHFSKDVTFKSFDMLNFAALLINDSVPADLQPSVRRLADFTRERLRAVVQGDNEESKSLVERERCVRAYKMILTVLTRTPGEDDLRKYWLDVLDSDDPGIAEALLGLSQSEPELAAKIFVSDQRMKMPRIEGLDVGQTLYYLICESDRAVLRNELMTLSTEQRQEMCGRLILDARDFFKQQLNEIMPVSDHGAIEKFLAELCES